ncbi:MAG: glycoside hydrolase [Bacteroidales bacterium]|nr:glycoside hydrolase [Bacteroidales bacterium]
MKQKTSLLSFSSFFALILLFSCKTYYGTAIYKPDTSFKVVGYISGGSFDKLDSIELNKLTYLNLAFANPDKEGYLVMDDNADVSIGVNKGHAANLKVFISLGGGGRPDTVFWKAALQPGNRSSFIKKIVKYVEENNLDGVDVDIEGNLFPYIGFTYGPFVVELKKALHAKGKGMSCALGAVDLDPVVTNEALEAYDFVNVMVYDKTGIWRPNVIGPHSPFSFAEDAIKYYTVDRKILPANITLGLPFYGFDFTPPARYINYSEIIKPDIANAYRDSVGMRYYNSIPMISQKAMLAKKSSLGGVMIWELSCDTYGDLSLMKALDQTLKAGDCTVTSFFKDEDGDGYGNPSKPFQACNAPEGYVANMDDSDDSNPKVHPLK